LDLEEIGAPYRTEVLEFGTTMKSVEFLALNPMGKVPAIRHGDAAILRANGSPRQILLRSAHRHGFTLWIDRASTCIHGILEASQRSRRLSARYRPRRCVDAQVKRCGKRGEEAPRVRLWFLGGGGTSARQ
jgi:glutathione S-transferase